MAKEKVTKKQEPSDLEILEEIQKKIVEELRTKELNPRVGDLLKALELKMKLKLTDKDKKQVWELINQLREEELKSKQESEDTES